MNIVDSSGWLASFSDGPKAKHDPAPLNGLPSLMVPVIPVGEVFRVVFRESSENSALQAAAAMQYGRVIDLTPRIAMEASRPGLPHALAMADSIILATARAPDGVIWTQDPHFQHIDGLHYFPS